MNSKILNEKEIKKIMFDLFNKYENCEDIIQELRTRDDINNNTYNHILQQWDIYLNEWENKKI